MKPTCRADDLALLGLACAHDEPCPVLLELATVETVGSRLILAGNLHTESVTLESVLLVSEDAGRNWVEGHPRIPAATLDQMQFLDFETGWILGQTLLTLPRDPFFLISHDGGRTWRKYPVFSESRVGMVEGYWFQSRTKGSMTVDRLQSADNGMRYELYDSMTGGDSWMLRQLAETPIELKRPPEGESGLRLRADAASRAYRVERRAGDKWQLLAQFSVPAGECRAPEPVLAEPTPEAPTEPRRRPRAGRKEAAGKGERKK